MVHRSIESICSSEGLSALINDQQSSTGVSEDYQTIIHSYAYHNRLINRFIKNKDKLIINLIIDRSSGI